MANALEVFGMINDLNRLQEVADDLEEILLSIACDGKSGDLDYIKASQEYMKGKYGQLIEPLADDASTNPYTAKSRIGVSIASVISAYDGLQGILFLNDTKERIEEGAKDLLYEYLIFPEYMEAA